MKIRHYRPFFTGLLCLALCGGILLLTLIQGPSLRYLIGALLLAAMAGGNLWFACSEKDLETEIGGKIDERALFIAVQSGYMTLRILNGLLLAGALLALVAYGFTQSFSWIVVALTLFTVVLVLFVVLLCANCYCEKKY